MSDLYLDHAPLYEAAFVWDRSAEVLFLAEFIGRNERVLEPMCGPAYLLEAFALRGHPTVGVDTSATMLDLARQRFARAGVDGSWINADVCDFTVGEACGGAVCAVNSVAILPGVAAMGRHLRAVGQALYPGSAYLVQLDMTTAAGVRRRLGHATQHGRWTFDYDGGRVECEWFSSRLDERFDHQLSRFTFADGRVVEHLHPMKLWDWEAWSALVEVSGFRQEAAFSGDDARYTSLSLDDRLNDRPLTWHYLTHR